MSSLAPTVSDRFFTTGDGVRLHYIDAGRGKPLLLLHGWSQSAALFREQIAFFSKDRHVIALDLRGHGDSAKPEYGYNTHRMAMDVRELIVENDLHDVDLLAHSMGVKVAWAYYELFGPDRLSSLILIDDTPSLLDNPLWTETERARIGPAFTSTSMVETALAIAGPEGAARSRDVVAAMLSADFVRRAPDDFDWVVAENLKLPRDKAVQLLFSVSPLDWRSVLPRINLPTLVMGGEASTNKADIGRWIASQIPGAKLRIWTAAEGGSHFVFLENPAAFNAEVAAFLDGLHRRP